MLVNYIKLNNVFWSVFGHKENVARTEGQGKMKPTLISNMMYSLTN